MSSELLNKTSVRLLLAVSDKLGLKPVETGRIMENLFAVRTGTVNFFVYNSGEQIICFDAGFGKTSVNAELKNLEIDPLKVTHVFLTHSDFDHTAGLDLFGNARIYLSYDEEQMINGKRSRKLWMHNPRIKRSYTLLRDNEVVTLGDATVRAIETPGHTPGSMSYLLNGSILLAGDACRLADGILSPRGRLITMNMDRQSASIRKLAQLPSIEMILTAHNGYTTNCEKACIGWK
jgi:hydroxyacylglutathione hydrolase